MKEKGGSPIFPSGGNRASLGEEPPPVTGFHSGKRPHALHVRLILTAVTENGSCASVHYMALDGGSERLNDWSKVTRWVTRMPCPWHLAYRAK